ncbi:MAG: Rieske (2Fe-2S) domain protein [Ramlibacter sp.]|nr:Rieske (2Fe-2S) domain protein [Ramlibacter sp.]
MDQETADLLTRTGPGTPMGNLMRRYWVPVLSSSEIAQPDGAPVRVQILGEKLLAFRDTEGHAALIDEFCSHRGASLFFGRNEECGIRCSYHGLKFDRTGACVDVPSAPQVADRMRIKAYPCIERAGLVWAYMGPAGKQPEPPEVEWCTLPESHVFISKRWQQSNYLQAMEGGIDTAHVSYVHKYEVDIDPMHRGVKALDYIKADGNVIFDIEKNPFGLTLYGRRNGDADSYYWRITQWLFPWFTLIPPFGDHSLGGHVWVPIDDENCWAWSINYRPDQPLNDEEREEMASGKGIHVKYEDVQPISWRPRANKDNDYLMDRAAQKDRRAYSGVFGFSEQDASLQESMGAIQDRTKEKLLPTDKAIVMARRMLVEAALELDQGVEPPALHAAAQQVRAAGVLLPRDQDPKPWAQDKIQQVRGKPVYSL